MTSRLAIGTALTAQLFAAASAYGQSGHAAVTTFSLSNGLSVVVNEDPLVANVAVELWVRAGSRYEEPEHWGLAHFFEHMFGATRLPTAPGRVLGGNAQTRRDFCRYYILVDREAVEYAIAAQADRLDYPLDAMTSQRLNANRDIVINEFRGYESRPFGFGSTTDVRMLTNGFGWRHPYGRPLQRNDDVSTISDADMRRWIVDRYRPSESVLLVAGNAITARVRPLVERYFAPIPAVRDGAPPVARVTEEPIEPTPERHERLDVAASVGRVFAAWATPRYGAPDADYLSLFVELLAAPEVGRLHQQLVIRDQMADAVGAEAQIEELAGQIRATVQLRPGADAVRTEQAVVEAADGLANAGPTDAELRVAKARLAARAARHWERLGFQGSRIDLLGEGALYAGDPLTYRKRLDRIGAATRQDIVRASRVWITRHGYFLTASPRPAAAAATPIDRSRPVTMAPAPAPAFPPVTATPLTNGVTLATIERPRSTLVNLAVVMPAGAGDASERAQRIDADALTDRHPANQSRRADALRRCVSAGATIDAAVSGGSMTVTIDALAADAPLAFRAAAAILSDEPVDAGALARARDREASRASTEDTSAHTRATLASLLAGHSPSRSAAPSPVVVVSGAFDRPALDILGSVPVARRAPIGAQSGQPSAVRSGSATVYVVDEPGRSQTVLVAGEVLSSDAASRFVLERLAAAVLSARLYGNLREQHQWAYDAQAALSAAADGVPLVTIATELQTAHAVEAIAELRRECDRPVSDAETERLAIVRRDLVQQIAGSVDAVSGTTAVVADLARRGFPLTAAADLLAESAAVDAGRMREALGLLHGARLTFVLGGDAQTLMPQLKAAGIDAVLLAR